MGYCQGWQRGFASAKPLRTVFSNFLAAGTEAVWLIYPKLRVVDIHEREGVRRVAERDAFRERRLFSNIEFSLSLTALFGDNPER